MLVTIAPRAIGKVRTVCALHAPWASFVNLTNEKWFALWDGIKLQSWFIQDSSI